MQSPLIRNGKIEADRYPCCRLISDSKILIRINVLFILSEEFKAYAPYGPIKIGQRPGHFENERSLGNNCRRIAAQLGKARRVGKCFAKAIEFLTKPLPLTLRR